MTRKSYSERLRREGGMAAPGKFSEAGCPPMQEPQLCRCVSGHHTCGAPNDGAGEVRLREAKEFASAMGDDETGHCRGCGQPIERFDPDCAVCMVALDAISGSIRAHELAQAVADAYADSDVDTFDSFLRELELLASGAERLREALTVIAEVRHDGSSGDMKYAQGVARAALEAVE